MDTRLVFIAGDDDFMHEAGVTWPVSQKPDMGAREGYDQFYDKRDSSESGRESRTHLVLHKNVEGYFPGLRTEAAMVMKVTHKRVMSKDPRALSDDGSYIRIEQKLSKDSHIGLLMMPFSTDRLRLGWFWDTSWGGNQVFPGAIDGISPGFKLYFEHSLVDAFVGMKTARLLQTTNSSETDSITESFFGVFGGLGVGNKKNGIRAEVQGAYFDKGNNPNGPVRGEKVTSGGGSARLSFVKDLPIDESADIRLYSADPLLAWNNEDRFGGLRFNVAAEGTYLGQVLEDPDKNGGTKVETGYAGVVHGTLVSGDLRLNLHALARSTGFLFFNAPGAINRFQAISTKLDETPEMVVSLAGEYHFAKPHLTPGLTFGAQMPASLSDVVPNAGNYAPSTLQARQTVVFRRADMFDDTGLLVGRFMPQGHDVKPIFGGRLHLQWDLAEGFALIGEVSMLYDDNRVYLKQDDLHVNAVRDIDDPLTVGAALMARAEW